MQTSIKNSYKAYNILAINVLRMRLSVGGGGNNAVMGMGTKGAVGVFGWRR